MSYDHDPPEAYSERWRKARKVHRCGECCSDIQRGERYEYVSGIWDGEPSTHKTCVACVALRDAAMAADRAIDATEPPGFVFSRVYEGAAGTLSVIRHYDAPAECGTLAGLLWLYVERVNNGRGFG